MSGPRPSRRAVLAGGVAAAAAAGLAPLWARPRGAAAAAATQDVLAPLIVAADRAVFLYAQAATAQSLGAQARGAIVGPFAKHHKDQRDALAQKLRDDGGSSPAIDQAYPDLAGRFGGAPEHDVLAGLRDAETALIAGYVDAIPRAGTATLASGLATILGVDAQHVAVLSLAVNEPPTTGPFVGRAPV